MKKRIPIFLGLLLTLIATWLLIHHAQFRQHLLERLEHLGYDLQLRTRILTERTPLKTVVAIIDIDDKSIKQEGRLPWSRTKLAQLVDALQKQGAAVIAFDMFFSEPDINIAASLKESLSNTGHLTPSLDEILTQKIPLFNRDETFAASLKNTNAILATSFLWRDLKQNKLPPPLLVLSQKEKKELALVEAKGYITNIPILQATSAGNGFLNIFPDTDGIIRHAPLLIEYQGGVYPSLALQAVLTFLNSEIKLVTPVYNDRIMLEGIQLGSVIIPTDAQSQVLIPFVGRSYTFPFYSATDVMHGNMPKDALLGKIVFIGTSATGAGDLKATAIENPFPGVEIQATLAHGLILNNFSQKPAWTFGAQVFITLLFGIIAACTFPFSGPRILGLVIILFPPVLLLLNNWLWHETGLVLSVIVPLILVLILALFNIIYGYLFETRKRERLKEMFGQYVPEKHIDQMLKTSSNYALRGEDRDMSVLFADIRGFTTISEKMSAAELVEMLNTFFTPMTEIIFNHHGTIDKYVGDLIMAFWGAPLKDKNHARHAIQSALEMQAKLKSMETDTSAEQFPKIKMGIGINSGSMSVGDMGSRFRRNYTVLGDAVNLASRVEGLTKFYDVEIIVTENTAKDQPQFIFRKLDLVRVKGKEIGLSIFEVVCLKTKATPEITQSLMLYHKALDYYYKQQWEEAKEILSQLHQTYPQQKIYSIYLDRINTFQACPPPADWQGTYVHLEK